jgi:hypothetical protein
MVYTTFLTIALTKKQLLTHHFQYSFFYLLKFILGAPNYMRESKFKGENFIKIIQGVETPTA